MNLLRDKTAVPTARPTPVSNAASGLALAFILTGVGGLAWVSSKDGVAPSGVSASQARPDKGGLAGPDPAWKPLETEVLRLVNVERRRHGVRPLLDDGEISALARAHSRNMMERGFFSHEDHLSLGPDQRREAYLPGYFAIRFGENIAAVVPPSPADAPAQLVRSWMDSTGHRKTILDPEYTHSGVGVVFDVRGKCWATHDFSHSMASVVGEVPKKAKAGSTLRVRFRWLGGGDRKEVRVAVIFPDPEAKFDLPGGAYILGKGYYTPTWQGDEFEASIRLDRGRGAYRIALGRQLAYYQSFICVSAE